HFMIEEETGAGDGDATPETAVQGRGNRGRVPFCVDDRVMRGVDAATGRDGRWSRRRMLEIDLRAQRRRVRLREETLDRHLDEVRVAEPVVPVDERAPHRLSEQMLVRRRAQRRD